VHPRPQADDPVEWLNRARSNLKRAKADARLEGIYWEDLCFDAQQAAEKAIKAVLLHYEIEFPYVHDLARLLTLLSENDVEVPEDVKAAETMTPYATTIRYPMPYESMTKEQYEEAVHLAETVVTWAQKHVETNS
jgi:HEPN domain-containing protein